MTHEGRNTFAARSVSPSLATLVLRYSRLDQGSRKLSGSVKDHINPESWDGDYDPRGVDLQACWKTGAQLAAAALTECRLFAPAEVDFAAMAAAGATLLSPFPGEGRPGVKVDARAAQ